MNGEPSATEVRESLRLWLKNSPGQGHRVGAAGDGEHRGERAMRRIQLSTMLLVMRQVVRSSSRWLRLSGGKGTPGARSTTDQLMLVDLAGMTAWLRVRGVALGWPDGVASATESLSARVARRSPVRHRSRDHRAGSSLAFWPSSV